MKQILFFTLLTAFFLSSCASRKDVSFLQADTSTMRQEVISLKAEQQKLVRAVNDITALLNKSSESGQTGLAETRLQLRDMTQQVAILTERISDLERQAARSGYAGSSTARQPVQTTQPTQPTPQTTDNPVPLEERSQPTSVSGNGDTIYQSAYQDLVNGKYDLAVQGFKGYLQNFPNTNLADNAYYWIGEAHYARQQFDDAAQSFSVVIADFPYGDKISAAILKLAYSQIALGQTSPARENLQKVINMFPNSNEAALAQAKLGEL